MIIKPVSGLFIYRHGQYRILIWKSCKIDQFFILTDLSSNKPQYEGVLPEYTLKRKTNKYPKESLIISKKKLTTLNKTTKLMTLHKCAQTTYLTVTLGLVPRTCNTILVSR